MDPLDLTFASGSSLAKRDCVSDCVVPSCSSVTCGTAETCILSSQTCDQCPSVSCVSLAVTNLNTQHHSGIPKGAIAGIVIAIIALAAVSGLLAWIIWKRRRTIYEINEKASVHELENDLSSSFGQGQERLSSIPSHVSIQIGLSPALAQDASSNPMSNLPSLGDHFFSADELLRMSYADSRTSLAPTIESSARNDGGAAIIQANNPVTAVRAKAAVLQFSKSPTTTSPVELNSPSATQHVLPLERLRISQRPMSSFWDDSESVLASPIERDLISPSKFSVSSRSEKGDPTTPTKRKSEGRLLTGDSSSPPQAKASEMSQDPSVAVLPTINSISNEDDKITRS